MPNKLPCGCIPDASGFGWCSECCRKLREKIWRNMSNKRKQYDRHFAPQQSAALDEACNEKDLSVDCDDDQGCSCHINPPCAFCMSKDENSS